MRPTITAWRQQWDQRWICRCGCRHGESSSGGLPVRTELSTHDTHTHRRSLLVLTVTKRRVCFAKIVKDNLLAHANLTRTHNTQNNNNNQLKKNQESSYLEGNEDGLGFGFESYGGRALLHSLHGILYLMNATLNRSTTSRLSTALALFW